MLEKLCASNDYIMSADVSQRVLAFFKEQVEAKNENFANGRLVRNIYDDLVMNHARRVATYEHPTRENLALIIDEDFSIPHTSSKLGQNLN